MRKETILILFLYPSANSQRFPNAKSTRTRTVETNQIGTLHERNKAETRNETDETTETGETTETDEMTETDETTGTEDQDPRDLHPAAPAHQPGVSPMTATDPPHINTSTRTVPPETATITMSPPNVPDHPRHHDNSNVQSVVTSLLPTGKENVVNVNNAKQNDNAQTSRPHDHDLFMKRSDNITMTEKTAVEKPVKSHESTNSGNSTIGLKVFSSGNSSLSGLRNKLMRIRV
jgi:hypothetical protein